MRILPHSCFKGKWLLKWLVHLQSYHTAFPFIGIPNQHGTGDPAEKFLFRML